MRADTGILRKAGLLHGKRLLILLIVAAAAAGGIYWKRQQRMNPHGLHGTVVAALGDTIAEVNARSTYRLNEEILQDEDLSAADRPVQFVYRGSPGLKLPPTRTIAFFSAATVINSIETAPQLEYLGIDDVLALADTLEPRILAAGWVPDLTAPGQTSRRELPSQLVDPDRFEVTAFHIAIYRLGTSKLTLRLRRLHKPQPGFPGGAFLLNFVWWDDALEKRTEQIVDRFRQEDGVTNKWPRRVSAKSYGDRVRKVLRQ